MKEGDYITILAPMVSKLGLSGNNLIIFSLIHGFSKDEESKFTGSLDYIAKWTNLSKNSVMATLSLLTKDGFIDKHENIINGVKFCSYTSNYTSLLKKLDSGAESCIVSKKYPKKVVQNLDGGSAESAPNIINNIDKEINYNKETKDNKLSLSKKVAKNEWRKNFDVYKAEVEKGRDLLLADEQYKKQMTDMYPNIDFYRTIIKVFNFWITDKGWEYKKKSKSINIDMAITFKRNIDKNIVYKNRANMPIENKTMLELKIVDSENGTLEDGTIFKNGYRYYFSMKDKRTYSIPIKAPKMPNDYSEWDYKKNVWYYPKDNKQETINDMLW